MTPDTAALRAQADHIETLPPLTFAGQTLPPEVSIATDTLRALCDAADEVKRLTSKYEEWESMHSACIALREDVARHEREAAVLNESIARHARDLDAAGESLRPVAAERDAARTALAALVADLRALCDEARGSLGLPPIDCTNACGDGPCDCSGITRTVAWTLDPARVRALLDRHAPEEGR